MKKDLHFTSTQSCGGMKLPWRPLFIMIFVSDETFGWNDLIYVWVLLMAGIHIITMPRDWA